LIEAIRQELDDAERSCKAAAEAYEVVEWI
jgi:hypothetical protein